MNASRDGVPATTRFGRFLLDTHRRELLADEVPVPIGSRAFDVLIILVEASGQLVTKDELLSRVWSGRVVEENTLQFQISTLRKALGPDRHAIKTISGRGYRFIADISVCTDLAAGSIEKSRDSPPPDNLPASISGLTGRKVELAELADLIAAHGLVALARASGIGKTRQGQEFERRLLSTFADGVWLAVMKHAHADRKRRGSLRGPRRRGNYSQGIAAQLRTSQ